MKNIGLKCLSATVLGVLAITGCQDNFQPDKEQIAEGVKSAFSKEIESFFENKDLADALGISQSEQSELEQSIRSYIDNYELDEEALKEAKTAVSEVLENAKGFSAEEIEDKIASIFEKESK